MKKIALVAVIIIGIAVLAAGVFVFQSKFSADETVSIGNQEFTRSWSVKADSDKIKLEDAIIADDKVVLSSAERKVTETAFSLKSPGNFIGYTAVGPSGEIAAVSKNCQFWILNSDGSQKAKTNICKYERELPGGGFGRSEDHQFQGASFDQEGNLFVLDMMIKNLYVGAESEYFVFVKKFSADGTELQSIDLSEQFFWLSTFGFDVDRENGDIYVSGGNMSSQHQQLLLKLSKEGETIKQLLTAAYDIDIVGDSLVTYTGVTSGHIIFWDKEKFTQQKSFKIDQYTNGQNLPGRISFNSDASKIFYNVTMQPKVRVFSGENGTELSSVPTPNNSAYSTTVYANRIYYTALKQVQGASSYVTQVVATPIEDSSTINEYLPKGSSSIAKIDSGQNETTWNKVTWTGSVPSKTSIKACIVSYDLQIEAQNGTENCVSASGQNFPVQAKGRFADLKLVLETSDKTVTPSLSNFSVTYKVSKQAMISSVTAKGNYAGSSMTIKGKGFGSLEGAVFIGGAEIKKEAVAVWKDDLIEILSIPIGAKHGKISVLPAASNTESDPADSSLEFITYPTDFPLLNPIVESFSRQLMSDGSVQVTVTGKNFGNQKGSVYVGVKFGAGPTSKYISSWAPEKIIFTLPYPKKNPTNWEGKIRVITYEKTAGITTKTFWDISKEQYTKPEL